MRYLARLFKFHWMLFRKHNKSIWSRESVSELNIPIPWYTYGAIYFLMRINAENIFEYGCGNSTLFWSKRCKNLYFVEHDSKWFEKIIEKCPKNVEGYETSNLSVAYPNSISIPEKKFDMIIIDGEERMRCAAVCIPYLSENGVIVLDNSDRFLEVSFFLQGEGFVEIPFKGIGPINEYEWTTSVFVKNLNLWKIA